MAPRVTIRRKKKRGPVVKVPKGASRVKVGFPAGTDDAVLNRAVWNNYGTRNIPERPFMDNAIRDNASKYEGALARFARQIVRGNAPMRTVLARLGIIVQGDIQTEITALADPPNAASTVAAKGSSNPLIDSGEMRAATTWKVDE